MDRKMRDRGTKKWTAMMLPEHVVALKDWLDEDHYVERPEFDDWELQLIQDEIEIALKHKKIMRVRTWRAGKIGNFQGVLKEVDFHSGCIVLEDPFDIERIPVAEIIGIQRVN